MNKPDGRSQLAHDFTVVLPSGIAFVPGGRKIEFDASGPSGRVPGYYFINVGTPFGSSTSVTGSRFWIRVVSSDEGIEQRSYSEGSADFPADQADPADQSGPTPGRIVPGDPATGRADPQEDTGDMYRLALDADVPYLITAQGESEPVLNIQREGRSRDELAADSKAIIYTPEYAGTHYLRVRNRSTSGDPGYEIDARPLGEPARVVALTPGRDGGGTGYSGRCGTAGDLSTVRPAGDPHGLLRFEHRDGQLNLVLEGQDSTLLRYARGTPEDNILLRLEPVPGSPPDRAIQGFSTGVGSGARLKSVVLYFNLVNPGEALRVSIHADDGGAPAATALYTLGLAPGVALADGRNEFFAPEGARALDGCTSYHLVVEPTGVPSVALWLADHKPNEGRPAYESARGWTMSPYQLEHQGSTQTFGERLWMEVTEADAEADAADAPDFDWLAVGGAAFPNSAGDGVHVSEAGWRWPAPEAPWTVGRRVLAEFYGQGAAAGPALWSAVLEPGQDSGGDTGQDSGETRSGYAGSVSSGSYGELRQVRPGESGLDVTGLVYQADPAYPGAEVLVMDLNGAGLSGLTLLDGVSGGSVQSVNLGSRFTRVLLLPFRTGPQNGIDLGSIVVRFQSQNNREVGLRVSIRREQQGDALFELRASTVNVADVEFLIPEGRGTLEPGTQYWLVLRASGNAPHVSISDQGAAPVALSGWSFGAMLNEDSNGTIRDLFPRQFPLVKLINRTAGVPAAERLGFDRLLVGVDRSRPRRRGSRWAAVATPGPFARRPGPWARRSRCRCAGRGTSRSRPPSPGGWRCAAPAGSSAARSSRAAPIPRPPGPTAPPRRWSRTSPGSPARDG